MAFLHSRLKTLFPFLNLFPPIAIYPIYRLIAHDFTTHCFDSHWWRNIGNCDGLSQLSRLSVTHCNIVILLNFVVYMPLALTPALLRENS